MKRLAAVSCLLVLLLALVRRYNPLETDLKHEPTRDFGHNRAPASHPANTVNQSVRHLSSRGHRLIAKIEANSNRHSEALECMVKSVSGAAQIRVLNSLLTLTEPDAAEWRHLLVRRWAENNPSAAASWAAGIPEGLGRREALEQVAIVWANTDLGGSVAWLHTLPYGETRQAAALAIAYEAARAEPLTALELAQELPAMRERDDLVIHAVRQWARTDFSTAADWAGNIADFDLRTHALAALAVAAAEQNAAAAAALVANALDAGETQSRAAVAIVQRWVQTSPRDAAAWVLQFPDIPARDAALQNFVVLWTAQSAGETATWLAELPEGSLRDLGFTAFTQALAQKSKTQPSH